MQRVVLTRAHSVSQRGDFEQVRAQLLALHGLLARRGDQVRDVQPGKVSAITAFLPRHLYFFVRNVTDVGTRCLGIEDRKGSLRPGADADLVVMDPSGNILSTWVKGKEVWTKPVVV